MNALDYTMELEVDCPDNDVNDVAFVRVIAIIGGHNAVEEFLACGMYPLSSGFGFRDVAVGMTVVLRVETSLSIFPVEAIHVEEADRFLAMVKMDTERILGSYGHREQDALMTAKLLIGGHLNWLFDQKGAPCAPQPMPGTEAS
jgi:hypothetical protein